MEPKIIKSKSEWKSFCTIANAAFEDWSAEAERLSGAENYIFSENGQDIGIATAHVDMPEIALLRNIAISPDRQGQGYGARMLSSLEQTLSARFKAVELMTEPKNIGFYEASGYSLENSLHNGLDWRHMSKNI